MASVSTSGVGARPWRTALLTLRDESLASPSTTAFLELLRRVLLTPASPLLAASAAALSPHEVLPHSYLLLATLQQPISSAQSDSPSDLVMAEALLLPMVRGVVGKAGDVLVKRVTEMWGIDDDRDKLERRLGYVQSLLADAEAKSDNNHAVKVWMKALKSAAYKADDVLDDFQYEALRLESQTQTSAAGSMKSKVLSCFDSKNRLVFRYKASRELKIVLDEIDGLVEEMNKFNLERMEVPPQVPRRQTHSALFESTEIFGRDGDKEKVVKKLLNQRDQHNVQVLPIIGMGGLGKTTLAKMVYNDSRVQKHFVEKMWHCVSDNFEAAPLLRSIIDLATTVTCDLPDNIELLRRRLQEVIGRKRFLLILDDVWNEEPHKWEDDLKPILCSTGGKGSMIVITSRSPKVASLMGTLPPLELECLNEVESWELFKNKAFSNGVQEQEEFVRIGWRIVKKCKGLPLALKTMGGLMNSKQRVYEWEAIAESDISDTSGGKEEVLPILKLSYKHLSPELKQCFAFCAVYPKDYVMDKDRLIKLWMANGFIHEDEGATDLAQKGEFLFSELASRAFLQDVNVKEFCVDSYYYEAVGCKIHDLMHDLAKCVTDECPSVEGLSQKRASVCHMQLSRDEFKQISRSMKGTSLLRTLLTQSEHKDLNELKLRSLRALCCYNPSIHTKFINASHLRYLDLSGSGRIIRLPNSLCTLYNLQSLWLNGCSKLQHLPDGITTMRKLNHIYLFDCSSLQQMPPKLSLMHNLQTLTRFIVGTEDGFGIEELKDLGQLGGRLELYNLRNVKSPSMANLRSKHNLNELLLDWDHPGVRFLNEEVASNNVEAVLESLEPHSKLKVLSVYGYGGMAIPHWMRDPLMFQCLRELHISNCPGCTDLPIVWLSSSLEYLNLSRMNCLTTLCKSVDVAAAAAGYNTSLQIFPKLKKMVLENLPELESWEENSAEEPNSLLMLPKLEELLIRECYKLPTLPESPVLTTLLCHSLSEASPVPMSMPLSSWPSIVSLTIGFPANVVPPIMEGESRRQGAPDTLRELYLQGNDGFISTFNLSNLQLGLRDFLAFVEALTISSCSIIVHWPMDELQYFPRLRTLLFYECKNLQGMGSSSEEIFPLPQLEVLKLLDCDSVWGIPKLSAPEKLRTLSLCRCGRLKALPDGLSSLEQLGIYDSPGIKEFPQDLKQRLPAIKLLHIHGCPDLQRRFREKGGEYFRLVPSALREGIEAEAEAETETNCVKRFLPFCGGDS